MMSRHIPILSTACLVVALMAIGGCKYCNSAAPAAEEAATSDKGSAETPEADNPTDERARRAEALRKRREARTTEPSSRRQPAVKTVEEHLVNSRTRITAENYKNELDRLERSIGKLERSIQRNAPAPGGAPTPPATGR